MASAQVSQEQFAQLFADKDLTPQKIYDALDDTPFEFFVKYVFEQAGYVVEHTGYQHGPGLDLKVSTGAAGVLTFHAGVQAKHFQPGVTKVTAPQVVHLRGGLPQVQDVRGYFVTTSTFNDQALAEAKHGIRIWPIDGDHLIRYITYIRGSRVAAALDTDPDPILHSNPLAPIPPEVFFTADTITRRPAKQTTVLSLANHKGGVGKTTSALNIAFGLAAQNKQVLLVDLDAQANLTRALPPMGTSAARLHIGDYFTHKHALADLIRPTQFKHVWLIPSDKALTHSDMGIAAGPGAELRFVRDLHAPDIAPPQALDTRPFDWIIIDTGPHMGLFTRSALAASHYVILPLAPSVFADLGLDLVMRTVETMSALINAPIRMLGALVTQCKPKPDKLQEQLLAAAKIQLGTKVPLFKAQIPLDKTNIEKAHIETGQGKKKNIFDHKSAAAQAYTAVVREILDHDQ